MKENGCTKYPRRRNVTTPVVGLKNGYICKNLTQNGEPQRYSLGEQKNKKMHEALHKVATEETEKIKRTTKRKVARRHSKGGDHLEQITIEGTDGGLHPAVDGQSLK